MKIKIYRIFLLLLSMAIGERAVAQQDAQFSHYMFNSMYLNAGYAGMDGAPRFMLIHRSQWAGYGPGAPTTQVLTFNAPLMRLNSGVGIQIVNDAIGPWNNMEAQLSYSYHFALGSGKLGLGIRGGVFSKAVNRGLLRAREGGDEVVEGSPNSASVDSQFRPDMAAGVWYKTERYYAGIGVNHLLRTEFDFEVKPAPGQASEGNRLENHINLTAGYNYELSYALVLTPSFLIKSDFKSTQFEVSTIATYNDRFWGGLSYRHQDAAIVMAGFSMLKDNALRFGYGFDYTIPNAAAKQPTSHEVFLTYTLPAAVQGSKPIIRTPRFRH
jgi:type IX secretion system PorP/SprF family membrane protein